jgi:small subunit ribosomal protein S8
MSMTDPIADMLTRIRNAVLAKHRTVSMPGSKMKLHIAQILKDEGFIDGFEWAEDAGPQPRLDLELRWVKGSAAIEGLTRISKPGQRRYARSRDIPKIRNGLGILIVSTPRGVMTDAAARKAGVGGELICSVW